VRLVQLAACCTTCCGSAVQCCTADPQQAVQQTEESKDCAYVIGSPSSAASHNFCDFFCFSFYCTPANSRRRNADSVWIKRLLNISFLNNKTGDDDDTYWPEMIRSFLLPKATARYNTDASLFKQLIAIHHVRLHTLGLARGNTSSRHIIVIVIARATQKKIIFCVFCPFVSKITKIHSGKGCRGPQKIRAPSMQWHLYTV